MRAAATLVFAAALVLPGCTGITDFDREILADYAVTKYIREGGADKVESRKAKVIDTADKLQRLVVPEITGDAFNLGVDLIADQISANPEDVKLAKYVLSRFGVTVPDLTLPVTEDHLRIAQLYIDTAREAVAEFE